MSNYISAKEIQNELGISRTKSYEIVKQLNSELESKGYLVVRGKVPRRYFNQRFFIEEDWK